MYIESRYLAHRGVRKRHHIVFIIASTLLFIGITISLFLHSWVKYCWWDFGLIYASSFTTFTNFENESTISDVNSDSCQSLESFVERNCPDFCSYISGFEIGGGLMVLFSSLSLFFHFFCILFHIWSFFKVQFKFKRIGVLLVLSSACYLVGFFIYICLLKFFDLKNPVGKENQAEKFHIEIGLYFAFVIAPLSLIVSTYGMCKTRIAFVEKI